mmetsp:Transcript_23671/g.39146  ORF Transcript_23671/g.39146 Transcript_23671/m.39146 type:complete len:89 (+) Transcript_23671:632-898(+)
MCERIDDNPSGCIPDAIVNNNKESKPTATKIHGMFAIVQTMGLIFTKRRQMFTVNNSSACTGGACNLASCQQQQTARSTRNELMLELE